MDNSYRDFLTEMANVKSATAAIALLGFELTLSGDSFNLHNGSVTNCNIDLTKLEPFERLADAFADRFDLFRHRFVMALGWHRRIRSSWDFR